MKRLVMFLLILVMIKVPSASSQNGWKEIGSFTPESNEDNFLDRVQWHPEKNLLLAYVDRRPEHVSVVDRWIVYDPVQQEIILELNGKRMMWSSTGKYLADIDDEERQLTILDSATGGLISVLGGLQDIRSINWHTQDKYFSAHLNSENMEVAWNISGQRVAELTDARFGSIDWSPDGKYLSYVSNNRELRLIDLEQPINSENPFSVTNVTGGVAWHPFEPWIAVVQDYTKVRIWTIETGEVLHTFQHLDAPTVYLTWHPDGKLLGSLSTDPRIGLPPNVTIWDTSLGEVIFREPPLDHISTQASFWVNNAQNFVMHNLYRLRVWDAMGKTLVFERELGEIGHVRLSPDIEYLTVQPFKDENEEPPLEIYQVQGNEMIKVLEFPNAAIEELEWSADGQYFSVISSGELLIQGRE